MSKDAYLDHQWLTEDHRAFADSLRKFLAAEYQPHRAQWTEEGCVPHAFWEKAGAQGILGATVPEQYGGLGLPRDFDIITVLEQGRIGDSGWGVIVHNIALHYVLALATEDQKQRWLPKLASGEWVAGIAMTEPGTGSDLQNVRTTAIGSGNEYVINGSKTFISNGANADLIIVVAKTDPAAGGRGISLVVLETAGAEGFRRGRKLEKLGMRRQDTVELFFEDCRVPRSNLLGDVEGKGFVQLMSQLPWERLAIGYTSVSQSRRALELTLEYVKERSAFGQRLMDFQNTRFRIAEMATEIELQSAFLDKLTGELMAGRLTPARAAMAKMWGSEMQGRIVDTCLQLHGGYGYILDSPISELYADARVQRIYGGANEIMREIIARSLDQA